MSHPINTINQEAYMVTFWEREQKNKILKMSNVQRKKEVWNKLFPKMKQSDDWMLTANVF